MKFFAHPRVLSLVLALIACLHSSYLARHALGAAVPQGEQRLTQELFDNFIFYWESMLDLKFNAEEREELKRAVVGYWKTNNTAEIQNTLKQAEAWKSTRELGLGESYLRDMREAYQASSVAEARKETNDPVAVVLVRAFDRVHGFGGGSANSPEAGAVLAEGNPPLTQGMADKFISLYAFIFDLDLTSAQRQHIQSLLVESWKKNDREVINRVVGDVKFVGNKSKDELVAFLGADYQNTFVEGFRRAGMQNPVLRAFVEAFDRAHPDRVAATRAKGLADLVGTWGWDDALLQERDPYSGNPRGIGYIEAGTLEIAPGGRYKLIRTHRHCEGACCSEQGRSESGTISVDEGGLLVFQVQTGTEMSRDGCNAQNNRQSAIRPHRESYKWSIRLNPNHNNAPTLCWNTGPNEATCYIRKQ